MQSDRSDRLKLALHLKSVLISLCVNNKLGHLFTFDKGFKLQRCPLQDAVINDSMEII